MIVFMFFSKGFDEYMKIVFMFFSKGFDEYMNLVLDEAEEEHMKNKTKKPLGTL